VCEREKERGREREKWREIGEIEIGRWRSRKLIGYVSSLDMLGSRERDGGEGREREGAEKERRAERERGRESKREIE
jgi:hypothetical protein